MLPVLRLPIPCPTERKQGSLDKCLRLDLRQAMLRVPLILPESRKAMVDPLGHVKKTQEAKKKKGTILESKRIIIAIYQGISKNREIHESITILPLKKMVIFAKC